MLTLIAAILLAVTDTTAATPVSSATPSPAASATSGPVHTLRLNIPPGWRRTESGHYNEWRSPDGMSNFRVTPMPASKDFQGPGAADAVKAQFINITSQIHPNPNLTVASVSVCKGSQPAYRVDDPLGMGTPGFMMIIPGTISTGLINYEVISGNKVDPAIQAMIDGLCWP